MASIYKNADLTLIATRSPDPSGGCFAVSHEHRSSAWNVTDTVRQRHEVHSRVPLNHWPFLSNDLPLLRRGWALQERLLSTRTVDFTSDELVWECLESFTCECSKIQPGEGYFDTTKAIVHATFSDNASLADINSQWQTIVNLYSAKSLTYSCDIFPALQGLAKTVPAKMGPYLAGLWGKTLSESLSWRSVSSEAHPRPQPWRAPTWSWASTTGQIFWWKTDHVVTYATVLGANTTPKGKGVTAEIVSGELRLQGRCLRAKVRYGKAVKKPFDRQESNASVHLHDSRGWMLLACAQGSTHELRWDYGIESPGEYQVADGSDIFLTQIETGLEASVFLIIRHSAEAMDMYERIGLLKIWISSRSFVPDDRLIGERAGVAYAACPEMEITIT